MFKKFKDQVTSIFGADEISGKVETLQAMGFNAEEARNALNATDGNVDSAAELLLASGHQTVNNPPPSSNNRNSNMNDNYDDQLRRAMDASLQDEDERRVREVQEASASASNYTRTAAMNKAAEAAARRAETSQKKFGYARTQNKTKTSKKPNSNKMVSTKAVTNPTSPTTLNRSGGLTTHHPDVKVPTKLQNKSKEEQVLRCADRLKSYPAAVDTLYRALVSLRDNPDNDKFRKIDRSSVGYQRSIENAAGALDLLLAMNFRQRGSYELIMERHLVDHALLYLGISALEGVKQTAEYTEAKRKKQFAKDVKAAMQNSSDSEAIERSKYIAKTPSEPQAGSGALMQIVIADETIRRRFDGDDVLQDVINWIGGHGSVIPGKLYNREWCIVDINRYPLAPIDCQANLQNTLQYIGCWPSGRLEIQASNNEWRFEGNKIDVGSSRGLGSAPSEVLNN